MKIRILFLAMLWILSAPFVQAQWDIVTYEGREYVTLKSFCKFYKFNYPTNAMQDNDVTIKNATHTIRFRKGSQNLWLNQVRYWASLQVEMTESDWIISRKDVSKLFEPILRPHAIAEWPEWKGVVIDAGHGGHDSGARSRRGKREKDYALDTAFRLEKILKSKGISVVMTRRKDVYIELEERARLASRNKGHLFVSIHYNSAQRSARGLETYCFPPLGAGSTQYEGRVFRRDHEKMPGNENDVFNILLASFIHQQIVTLNPNDEEADRGVKRARFVVLKETSIPAALVEGGFLSNTKEAARVDQAEYRQSFAEKMARGIELFINRGVTPVEKTPENVSTGTSTNKPSATPPTRPATTNAVPSKVTPPVTSTNSVSKSTELPKKESLQNQQPKPPVTSVSTNSDITPSSPISPANTFTNLQTTNWVAPVELPPLSTPPASSPLNQKINSPVDSVTIYPPAQTESVTIPESDPSVPEIKESGNSQSVEIYMQSPQPRTPQVDLRLEEKQGNPVQPPLEEKKP